MVKKKKKRKFKKGKRKKKKKEKKKKRKKKEKKRKKNFKIAVPDWGLQLLKLSRRVNATREDTRQNKIK